MKQIKFSIVGKVQGVWFRASMQAEAQKLGLVGWVRNCSDGSVEAVAKGETEQIDQLISWSHQGSDLAEVLSVDIQEQQVLGQFSKFDIRS